MGKYVRDMCLVCPVGLEPTKGELPTQEGYSLQQLPLCDGHIKHIPVDDGWASRIRTSMNRVRAGYTEPLYERPIFPPASPYPLAADANPLMIVRIPSSCILHLECLIEMLLVNVPAHVQCMQ